jgi:DNA-binding MarR family transcriptional regulator
MDAELMAALSPTEQAVVLQSWATIGQQLATCDDLQIRGATETDIPGLTHYAWFFLRKARRNYRRIWREVAGETLSPSQFSLLDVVAANPGIDIRTAAGMASVEESTALRIVMRLVRTRLMRDAADPNDARRRLLSLTEPGSQAHRQIQELVPRIQADLCAKIPPQVVKSFFELTCRVARLSTQKGRPPTVAPTPITHTRKRENPAPKKAATIKTADQGATLSTR